MEGWETMVLSALGAGSVTDEVKMAMLTPYLEALFRVPPRLRQAGKVRAKSVSVTDQAVGPAGHIRVSQGLRSHPGQSGVRGSV